MADIEIKRAHHLGLEAARAAADKMAEHLGRKFGLQGDWIGNTLKFQRPGVTGSLAIDDDDLKLVVNLGLMLKMMRPSIEAAVVQQLDSLFKEGAAPRPPSRGDGASSGAGGARSKKAGTRPKKGG